MAGLWWQWDRYTLSEANEGIGEIYGSIANGLPNLGYAGVQHGLDVHGSKGSDFLAVLYLYIGNRDFWQVIACSTDGTTEEAQARISEVKNLIKNIHPL